MVSPIIQVWQCIQLRENKGDNSNSDGWKSWNRSASFVWLKGCYLFLENLEQGSQKWSSMRTRRENEGGRGTPWDKNLPKADGFGKLKKSVRNQLLVVKSLSKSASKCNYSCLIFKQEVGSKFRHKCKYCTHVIHWYIILVCT